MRRLILLTALLLLGAACNQKSPPPPPPPAVQDPPAAGPLALSFEGFDLKFQQTDPNLGAQIYVGPEDGSWRDYLTNLNPNSYQPRYLHPAQLRLRQGRLEVWAQDLSYNQVYGGRRFRWVYHFRVDDSGFPPKLVYPDGPVAFEVLERFPWGDKIPTDESIQGYLRDVSVGGAFQVCIRQDWNPPGYTLRQGLWGTFWQMAGSASLTTNFNFLVSYTWFDGQFMGRPGIQGSGGPALGPVGPGMDFNNPTTFDSGPQTHSAVLISKSLGNGKYRQAWEGRWFRAYNKGFGAWPDPTQPGGVRCEYGEGWRTEEVTDPGEIALLEQYQSTMGNPNYQQLPPYPLFSRLDPKLCPKPWRQGDGTCQMNP